VTPVNPTQTYSTQDFPESNYSITETSNSWNYKSTSLLVDGSGSFNNTTTGASPLSGGSNQFIPLPPSINQLDNIYSVGNLGVAFNKKIDVMQGTSSYETHNVSRSESVQVSSNSAVTINTTTASGDTSTIVPTHVSYQNTASKKAINTEEYNTSNSRSTRDVAGVTTRLSSSNTKTVTITPQIFGKNAYIYQKEESEITTNNSDRTEILKNNLFFIESISKNETIIPYDATKFKSLNPKLGASLIGVNYYLVLPAVNSGYFQKDLWASKTQSLYQNSSNIYTTPEAELKDISVWKAVINPKNNTIEIKEDIKVNKFYPLSTGAVVVAASYYA
jgi:hypothetical protein